MRCIELQKIQQYIDGECNADENAAIEEHLSVCPRCFSKLNEMKMLADSAKQAIRSLDCDALDIPAFKVPQNKKQSKIKHIIYSLSAACIIFIIIFFVDKKKEPCAEPINIVQTITWEADANQPFANQDFEIQITDCHGRSTVFYLE
ncbi:MAG: zf-HC2 domain-containing protein [Prolixibacteraceae bacterium]|nr:zf-HC2 domain-containing protein [Prolixibacteraceae bacterium]MBN2648586.1 zf-HC2 domain-containing protein [Prolixibacteraceae bacterium]